MNYLYLLKSLLNIDIYNKYRHHIFIDKEQHKEIYYLYKILDTLIKELNRSITLDEFILAALHKLGKENYSHLLKTIKEAQIDEQLIKKYLKDIANKDNAYKLAQLAIEVSEGKRDVSEIKDLVSKFEDKQIADENPFVSTNLSELLSKRNHTKGLRWRLPSLNRSLGPLRKGDFGFIFARPETGKTSFLASEVSFFATQADSPILWFNNEEQGEKVMLRIQQATLGLSLQQLKQNEKENTDKYYNISKDNIKIIDSASLYKNHVLHYVKEFNPSMIIFDQIDKIKGFEADRNDLRLGSIYIWARELAKQYCPVIGVCQADGSGENKRWLSMDNVAEAKTSKQAEADWILGIGKIHEPGMENIRFLNISKNKLEGDDNSDPTMRHARIECLIEPEIARYRDF
jgi:KaiC/GvpD/RAD55 family RecA-like ATPase